MTHGRLLVILALAIVYAAGVSNGFYHYDEHFQILEFVGFKLGITPEPSLMWEYRDQIRPWMQPAIYYALLQPFRLAGLEDPFAVAMLFRLASGTLFFASLWLLLRGLPHLFESGEAQQAAAKVLTLSWFIPVLAVRTSSESMSAAWMTLSLGCVLAAFEHPTGWRGRLWFAAGGLAQGLAFQARYQIAFSILGLLAWLFFVRRVRWLDFLLLAGVSLASLGLGVLIDAWGYGEFVVAPVRYVDENLIQGRAAGQFGSSPFWEYAVFAATNFGAPFTLAMALALIVMWIRRPRHVLTWLTLPFVLGHCLVGHKEWRFMFPMAVFAGLALVLAVTPAEGRTPAFLARLWQLRNARGFRIVVAANLVALVLAPIMLVRTQLLIQQHLYEHLPDSAKVLVVGITPYSGNLLEMHFYRRRDVEMSAVAYEKLGDKIAEGRPVFVVFDKSVKPDEAMQRWGGELYYDSLPTWAPRFNYFNWTSRTTIWKVVRFP